MHRVLILVTCALLCASLTAPASAQSLPVGLPNHFAFGLEAGQGDTWLPQSGIPWDYRWQYLAGGVNTGHGWETWNPNGTFALNYANESDQHGYIPMFPYYEIFQSNGSCDQCGENQKDITNLNTPATMQAYYQNFALLMKRLGPGTYDGIKGFGKPALINIEPDFTGGYAVQAVNNGACFGFCTGRGNDPALLKAAVSSTSVAEVAGFPDSYVGYTQALAHLRDLYAPNVILGHDVSPWATGVDIGVDPGPNIDAAALGQQVGVFLSKTGPHDILWSNPLDRDAGQYEVQFHQNRWWDRLNLTFPNFTRWESFLHATLAADNNRPMLLWQVPVGNQYFRTENNTDGHFQDNRVEYLFNHIPELIEAGIVGALIGAGNAGNTTYGDAKNDGITNPPPICTTDGISSGQICNDHPSSVADDDGGYVRMVGQAYYQNPVPLTGLAPPPGVPPTAMPLPATDAPGPPTAVPLPASAPAAPAPASDSTAPQPGALQAAFAQASVDPGTASPGQDVALRADVTVSQDVSLLLDFEIWDSQSQKVWQTWHDGQSLQAGVDNLDSVVFTVPADLPPGDYRFKAGLFSAGWGTLYAWNDQAGTFTVTP
jgi:hypothetical protein